LLASLSCHGCQSQNGYQDKFTHVNLPCLMTGNYANASIHYVSPITQACNVRCSPLGWKDRPTPCNEIPDEASGGSQIRRSPLAARRSPGSLIRPATSRRPCPWASVPAMRRQCP
jgi:hypothetical protein